MRYSIDNQCHDKFQQNGKNNGTDEIDLITLIHGFVGGPVLSLDKAVCFKAPQRPIYPAGLRPSNDCKVQGGVKLCLCGTMLYESTVKLIIGVPEPGHSVICIWNAFNVSALYTFMACL